MSLWIDKHKPTSFRELSYHLDQAKQLYNLTENDDFPHLVIYGPNGAGKRTRINCILKAIYGLPATKTRIDTHTFETPSNKKIEITTIASNYHIEVTPSAAGFNDRIVIQELVKTMAQTQQFDSANQRSFKIIVINEAESLTEDAQHALRRTMEKYSASCRLILVTTSISSLTPAIRSRCLAIRVAAPSDQQIVSVLKEVAKKEKLILPEELAVRISSESERNLRAAILILEACRVQKYPFVDDQSIHKRDWQVYLKNIAKLILQEQSPERLLEIRERFYELLAKCIPKDVIFKEIYKELLPHCCSLDTDSDSILTATQLTQLTADFERRSQMGSKTIYHLEGWVANIMAAMLKRRDRLNC